MPEKRLCGPLCISIHALRVEGDARSSSRRPFFTYFYPRPPGGGRQIGGEFIRPLRLISIHALRVEGDDDCLSFDAPAGISIHALRVEGDGANSGSR